MQESRKKWWKRAITESLIKLRRQIAEAAYSTGLDVDEIEQLIQTYAELAYLLLNGEFIDE